jgi:serine/threonine protein kinase
MLISNRLDSLLKEFQLTSDPSLKKGRAEETCRKLFSLIPNGFNDASLQKIVDLRQFSIELSNHLQGTLWKRYWIFAKIFIHFNCGPLGKLKAISEKLSELYQEKVDRQKTAVVTAAALDSLSHYLVAVDPNLRNERWYEQARMRLVSLVPQGILKRFCQLAEIKEASNLSYVKMLKIAENLDKPCGGYVKKGSKDYEALPHSLFYDKDKKYYYVVLKKKGANFCCKGATKKITLAIELPPVTEKARLVAQAVLSVREMQKEKAIYNEVKDLPAMWKVLSFTEYERKSKPYGCMFLELADGNFTDVIRNLRFEEVLKVTLALAMGLQAMHNKKLIHSDIKRSNALLRINPDGNVSSGWIDFGLTWHVGTDSPPDGFQNGHYGTRSSTAPEIFGIRGFQGYFQGAELWAFGLMLYRCFIKSEIAWRHLLEIDSVLKVTKEQKEEMKRIIFQEIEVPLKALLEKKSLTKEEQFHCLIFKMIRQKSADRLDLKQVIQELKDLQK